MYRVIVKRKPKIKQTSFLPRINYYRQRTDGDQKIKQYAVEQD